MRTPRTFNRDLKYPVTTDDAGRKLCRWDKKPVARGRRCSCSDQCQIEVDVRTSAIALRRHTFDRDKGVCAACGTDTELLRRVLGYAGMSICNDSESYGRKWRLRRDFRFRWHWRTSISDVTRLLGFDVRTHFWEADHIVEVADGGDGGLANVQSLCIPCHKHKTKTSAGARARARRERLQPSLLAAASS